MKSKSIVKTRYFILALGISTLLFQRPLMAQETKAADTGTKAKTEAGDAAKPARTGQSELASKTAGFGKVSKSDEAYKAALDAHDMDAALKKKDAEGAFKGTVTRIFQPGSGSVAIVNFDENFRNSLSAVVRKESYEKLPDLKQLTGKEVLVTGKFADYQGRAQIIVSSPEQIKLVESSP